MKGGKSIFMRKWKVFLSMLCAMLAAIGLFACKNEDDPEPEPEPTGSDITNVTGQKGLSNLVYTDSETWADILAELQTKVELTCRTADRQDVTVKGADCDITSTIVFDADNHCEVGNYTVTVTPKANNPKKESRRANLVVEHDFKPGTNDNEICDYCKSTRVKAEEDTVIHYGTFHAGTGATVPAAVYGDDGTAGKVYTNKKAAEGAKTYIEEFGTAKVATNGTVEDVTIPTLTAGYLEPGMTITVKGTAKTAHAAWDVEDAGYFFPVLGIADKTLNNPVWEGKEAAGYVGGTAVFVRGEGWVLYNGVGGENGKTRPLAALSMQTYGSIGNGKGEYRNYGSWERATLGANEHRPAGWEPGQVPAVSDWMDWAVYSTGSTANTTSYSDVIEVEFTWNYREDNVVEIIYDVGGSRLICMIKVPDNHPGFDTMLHGDYVDMWITSYERIETRTPNGFRIQNVAEKNYYEGEQFDVSTVTAQFKYLQSGDQWFDQALSLSNIYATTAAGEPNDNTKWVALADNGGAVSKDYTYYQVRVSKGGETHSAYFAADGKVNVVANAIESVAGADVPGFANNNTVGDLAIGTDGTKIAVTPSGDAYVQTIPSGATWTNSAAVPAGAKYVALKVGGTLGDISAVKSGTTELPYYYDKTNGYLVLVLTSELNEISVEGLNTTTTVFDFSDAKGFKVDETIVKGTEPNWFINNTANTVTVTFTPGAGNTIDYIDIGGEGYFGPEDLMTFLADGDITGNVVTIKQEGTSWTGGTLTIVARFSAANLVNYAQRTISISVGGVTEFVYKIDYVADFVDDTAHNVDEGFYSFVSDGKIYLAKVATAGETLALNLNEGNENVQVIDLSYTQANGAAMFTNAAASAGADINVLDIAGGKIVLIEVDPEEYGITGTAYGYQLKTTDYSANFFAVEGNTAKLTAITGATTIIMNEGSCLEKGLSGNFVKAGNVSFVASPVEFAGSHKVASLAGGQTCSLCGETLSRAKFNKSVTLHDNEFVEVDDAFHSDATERFKEIYSGIRVEAHVGSDFYSFRNDGFVSKNGYGKDEIYTGDDFTTSFGEDSALRTPEGKIDDQGNPIDKDSYLAVLSAGAKFRINASYQDGTFRLVWKIYRADGATNVNGYGGTPYFEFWHELTGLTANEISVDFLVDGITANDVGGTGNSLGNMFWIEGGKLDKSMITTVTPASGSNVTYAVGNIENHFATVSATGGNVTAITDDVKTALGLKTADTTYTAYASFDINLTQTTYAANATVYADAALTDVYEAAKATVENGKISVTVAFGDNNAPATYYIDLVTADGNTRQADIKLDLSAVSMYETTAAVTNNAKLVAGGDITIVYDKLPASLAGVQLSVNDVKTTLAATGMTFEGTGITAATWNEANRTLTLTVGANANLTGVPEYKISLLDAESKPIVTSVVEITARPAASGKLFVEEEDSIYGYADGDKLYLYLLGEMATGTDSLEFSANNATTIANAKDTIVPYNLAYSLSGNNVAFSVSNDFTEKVTATHFEKGGFKLTQFVIDLSYFEIAANAEYYFYVTKTSGTTDFYYAVAADRKVNPQVAAVAERTAINANSCTSVGSEGYAITKDSATVGYYGIVAKPSHTWVQHATDLTLFECSVCHAILAQGDATQKAMAAMPVIGTGDNAQSIVDTGLTISFVNSNTATGEWTQTIATKGGINFALLCLDPYWNSVKDLADATEEMKTLAAKLYKTNCWPGMGGGSAPLGSGCFVGTTSYMTLTISVSGGIYAYKNGVFAFNYAANAAMNVADATDKTGTVQDFAKLFLLMVEKYGFTFGNGVSAADAIVQRGTFTADEVAARYALYQAEKEYLPKPHTHSYDSTTHRCTQCGALDPRYDFPTYTTDTAFTLGTDGTASGASWTGYTPTTGKYFAVEQGKKLTLTGTMKSQATENFHAPLVSIFSGKAMSAGIFRGDNYIIDGDKLKANEGWAIEQTNTHAGTSPTWADFRTIIADCALTIEIDWTNASQIVVKMNFVKTGGTTKVATQTYTVTPESGKQFNDQYSTEIGFESCYLNITSVTKTEA